MAARRPRGLPSRRSAHSLAETAPLLALLLALQCDRSPRLRPHPRPRLCLCRLSDMRGDARCSDEGRLLLKETRDKLSFEASG